METFDEATALSEGFNAAHWQHGPGGPTALHTKLHFDRSMVRLMAEFKQGGGTAAGWDKKSRSLTALCIEHALRLVAAFPSQSFDLPRWGGTARWLSGKQISAPKLDRSVGFRERILLLELDLRERILLWTSWLEQWGHRSDEPPPDPFDDVVTVLLSYAVWLGPKYDDPQAFFLPFEERIARLSKEQEYRDDLPARVS